jgi:tetratricopeptide (TPR) repeat protein
MLAARALLILVSLASPGGAEAFTNVAIGDRIDPEDLPTLDGGTEPLLSPKAQANVFIFFRPNQEHSTETLKAMAACEAEFKGKPIHWVAVVSSTWDPKDVRKVVTDTGIRMPVLVDQADRLYGKLGLRLHPVVGVADGKFKLLAYEPFMKVNYCDRIRARIQFALQEITAEDVRKVESPEKATMPGEIEGAALKRRLNLGQMLLRSKQFDKAAAEAAAILAKDPRYVPAMVLLGDARAGQGNCAEAVTSYDAALAIDAANQGALTGKQACAGGK